MKKLGEGKKKSDNEEERSFWQLYKNGDSGAIRASYNILPRGGIWLGRHDGIETVPWPFF